MKVYVEAKSKADLIRRLSAGEEISGYNYSMFGGEGHYLLDDTLEDGTIIAIYSQMSQGNPVAKSWATWTNGVLKAENWGGDPEGPLAKALDKARSADPTPPLVIESLDDWGDSQCSSCGTFDEVHECWNCDKQLCIDCDPGEMRSDLDGHTYCDNCGPNNGKKSPIKDQNSESFEAPRNTAKTFKKQGMWIRSWHGIDYHGDDDGGVWQRQREQNKKARELVKKMKSQGWTKIPNTRINKTLKDQNLVPQLISAMKKYNADVKKKWGGKKINMGGQRLAADYFIIDLDFFQEYYLTDPDYNAAHYFSGELDGYGALMKKGNQYRLIMTGGTDDDEAGYWSTPVVQFALKGSPTPGKAPSKSKSKIKAKKTTRKTSAKKKAGRKAPTISATRRKIGTRMRGNDGKMWEVKKSAKSQRWIRGAESFALEQRDVDPRNRLCPNCHGNLYAEGCVHHGIMPHPIMRAAEDQPCYICEKDQWTHQGVDTTYAVCDSCKASFVCRQCGSSKVDPPGRLSPTEGWAWPTAECHDCGAVWNPHKEGISATRLHSREESDSLFGRKLGGIMTRVTMGQRRRLDPRSGVEVPNEPSHYCACGNPLFIYPVWDLPESHRLGRESLKAECQKCGWEGVVQRHDTSQGDPPRSFNAPGATTFPALFKKATTGKIQEWRIRTEELPGGNWAYISSHGQVGGSMIEGKGVVIKAGKQGRTVEEQANAEAASKWKKKRDTGYFETVDEAENNLVLLPMLALDHKKRGHNIEWPAIGQPKLDGIRCLARLDSDGNISLTSRKNKPFPGMDHIRDELAARLQDLGKSVGDPFPNDIVIDGELYADPNELTFQQVTGLVRRDNKKPEDIENEKKLKLNVYDSINLNDLDMDFIDRHDLVSNNLRGMDSITIVENTPLADSDAIDPIHDQFVREGYEGLIIRNIKGPYKLNGRSKHLQKYKSFQDDEYEIVGYEEGKGNYEGTVIWVCETPEGKRFKIKPDGTHEQRSTWFENADDYIGHRITVRFFALTDEGIPRFPTGGWFRNYEAEEWDLDECAFCATLIYDDEDSTEFEDEQYHDLCLNHWLHMDAESETFEAPVTCEICGKTFDSFRGLNGHMNAHLQKRAEGESESNHVAILIGVLCGSALMAFISSKLK